MNLTLRPPQMEIMNEFGIRSVAPASPATAGNVNSSALYSSPPYVAPSFMNVKLNNSVLAKWTRWMIFAIMPQ